MLHVILPKWPRKPFKPVKQSRKQLLRAYCPNIFTLSQGQPSYIPTFNFDCTFGFFVLRRNTQQKQKKWSNTACWGEHYLKKIIMWEKSFKTPLAIFQMKTFNWKSQFEFKKDIFGLFGCEQKVKISVAKISKSCVPFFKSILAPACCAKKWHMGQLF